MGFDVGTTHIGVASIDGYNNTAMLYQIQTIRSPETMERVLHIRTLLAGCQIIFPACFDLIIENAAFFKVYRQVELAEMRISAALWFHGYGGNIKFVPPNSIRKQIFGNGRIKAHDVWEGIEPDALAALACAYYL